MLKLNKVLNMTLYNIKSLTIQPQFGIHHDGSLLPRQYNHKWEDWEKKILFGKNTKIVPREKTNYFDIL